MANQASYLKELIGQHNSSLLEDLEITEYVDTSLNARMSRMIQKIMYIMLFGSIILQSVSPSISSPFYSVIEFCKAYRSAILMTCMVGFYCTQLFLNDEAFEMYVDDKLVFSKLQLGRYPTEEVCLC
ncbi:hypothetical protein JH06_4790 [Blastocystis sp. subtype 4]|uniref:hypothetical protein n=1 Tax=Blastocystis sp. subtype 4 TaxID=944170 RepID=UPI0007120FCD|nr:hypothetical protein JH06_4790 [Blastocystis sp. subtype 4]KNB42404.1 hypothetical protein JH06_4790 [Blastocystis sp. subtype 4]|eukprot:XP_014525853.1 hypothetical protein JH06_4790 [Blastocystis sp. subtype 4]